MLGLYRTRPDVAIVVFGEKPYAETKGDRPTLEFEPAGGEAVTLLRSRTTEPKKFREVVRELSWLLGYEALADARVRELDERG